MRSCGILFAMNTPSITVYTDGASRGNPGLGGWAAIIMTDSEVIEIAGYAKKATNNQMELLAVEKALSTIKQKYALSENDQICVYADSTYVLNGLSTWVDGWMRKGWVTSTKTPVENKQQWVALVELRDFFGDQLVLQKVAGHSGDTYNDRCDELAVAAALAQKETFLFSGSSKEYRIFLEHKEVQVKQTKKVSSKKPYAYVSCVDGVVHSDSTWEKCEQRVKGKKGAHYKKVFSKEEETSLIQTYTMSSLL